MGKRKKNTLGRTEGSFSAEVLSAAGAENLNSPDSESSSSRFTERESSCKSSTSSSAGLHRGMIRGSRSLQCSAGISQPSGSQDSQDVRKASLGLPLEEVKSESTSADYVTATEGRCSSFVHTNLNRFRESRKSRLGRRGGGGVCPRGFISWLDFRLVGKTRTRFR